MAPLRLWHSFTAPRCGWGARVHGRRGVSLAPMLRVFALVPWSSEASLGASAAAEEARVDGGRGEAEPGVAARGQEQLAVDARLSGASSIVA
jgi:hypothetical protein